MSTSMQAQAKTALMSFTPAPAGLLQRKCACGQHTIAGGECTECQKAQLQRRAATQVEPAEVPAIVHEVLRSPGQPLDPASRAFFEPRFGHDFSGVWVHTDAKAVESARAVNALAYTVGQNVVFGRRQYAPGTSAGQKLLAHELAHVMQQVGSVPVVHSVLKMDGLNDQQEQEAETVSRNIVSGIEHGSTHPEQLTLRRKDDVKPVLPGESEKIKEHTAESLPARNHRGDPLKSADKEKITDHLHKAGVSPGTPLALPFGAKFLLHDTSSILAAKTIAEQKKLGRGFLGKGVSAYVPREAEATIARPEFYESRRPTTTEYEKATQTFAKPGDKPLRSAKKLEVWMQRRDTILRQVWNAATKKERDEALQRAFRGLSEAEKKAEIKGDEEKDKKKKGENFKAPYEEQMKNGSSEKIWTAGAWTVEEICNKWLWLNILIQVFGGLVSGANIVSEPSKEKELEAGCTDLLPFFTELRKRVGSIVAVEIVQPGVISKEQKKRLEEQKAKVEKRKAKNVTVNENTCNPNNPDIVPLKNPPYSDEQYASIVALYLQAAFIAGRFPEITTHFAVDAFIGGHCDPRCFNLTKLYEEICKPLGHGKGSTYGIESSYGTEPVVNNVWWDKDTENKICGTPPPV